MGSDSKDQSFITQQNININNHLNKLTITDEGRFLRLSTVVMVLLPVINYPDHRAVIFFDTKVVFTEIIKINGSDILGPVTVEVRLTLINGESKQELEQITFIFNVKQDQSLMESFLAFTYDFAGLYRSISKTLNPHRLYIAPPIHRKEENGSNNYNFYPIHKLQHYYKKIGVEKPEWLEEFYTLVEQIEQIKE